MADSEHLNVCIQICFGLSFPTHAVSLFNAHQVVFGTQTDK